MKNINKRALRGTRTEFITGKISSERMAKLKEMSAIGGRSIYALINEAVERYIDTMIVPGYPTVDIPDSCLDDCAVYCNDNACEIDINKAKEYINRDGRV